MADNSESRNQAARMLRSLPTPGENVRDGIRSVFTPPPSAMKRVNRMFHDIPGLTPGQRAQYDGGLKDIELYEWNQGALQRGMHDIAKYGYMPEFKGYFSKAYDNLTPRQIEAEYSNLFDETSERNGGIRPYDFNDFHSRLKERLDANAGVRGERSDMGKGDRLDNTRGDRLDLHAQGSLYPQPAKSGRFKDLVRALIKAGQRPPTYGGPR